MLVLLNGGLQVHFPFVPLSECHSLMLVLLNGGSGRSRMAGLGVACHSLMLVLLNGGHRRRAPPSSAPTVPLADACVTEWRVFNPIYLFFFHGVPLADACVTEWRNSSSMIHQPLHSATR